VDVFGGHSVVDTVHRDRITENNGCLAERANDYVWLQFYTAYNLTERWIDGTTLPYYILRFPIVKVEEF